MNEKIMLDMPDDRHLDFKAVTEALNISKPTLLRYFKKYGSPKIYRHKHKKFIRSDDLSEWVRRNFAI